MVNPGERKTQVRESFANVNFFFAKNGRFNKQDYWTTTMYVDCYVQVLQLHGWFG